VTTKGVNQNRCSFFVLYGESNLLNLQRHRFRKQLIFSGILWKKLRVLVSAQVIPARIEKVDGKMVVRLGIGVDGPPDWDKQKLSQGVVVEDCIGIVRKHAQIVL